MKSINESLQITKNFNLIAEALQLLQAHGIDPNLLADWIENERSEEHTSELQSH